ncbi:hypothetical protein RIF29_31525 [Crotalaria pallida]|uniref:Uncharacterized protein n=1 Tax=Crotalaria pallida TaxID=3830 RepID=A0AAN9EHQ7_CROPI
MLVLEILAHESEAPVPHGVELHHEKSDRIIEQHPVSGASESSSSLSSSESKAAEAPQSRRLGKHHSTDKSVAGGGVIIGGLVTAIFAAVFCYIRVTRKTKTVCSY